MLTPDCMNVLLQEDCSKSIIPDVENLHLKRLFSNALDTTIKTGKKQYNVCFHCCWDGGGGSFLLLLLLLHESKLLI